MTARSNASFWSRLQIVLSPDSSHDSSGEELELIHSSQRLDATSPKAVVRTFSTKSSPPASPAGATLRAGLRPVLGAGGGVN
jgi:hypothetical protein